MLRDNENRPTDKIYSFLYAAVFTVLIIQSGVHFFIEAPLHEGFCSGMGSEVEVQECFDERDLLEEEYELSVLFWSLIPALALLIPLLFFSAHNTFGKIVRAGLFFGVILSFVFAGLRAWFFLNTQYALYTFGFAAFLFVVILILWFKELL